MDTTMLDIKYAVTRSLLEFTNISIDALTGGGKIAPSATSNTLRSLVDGEIDDPSVGVVEGAVEGVSVTVEFGGKVVGVEDRSDGEAEGLTEGFLFGKLRRV